MKPRSGLRATAIRARVLASTLIPVEPGPAGGPIHAAAPAHGRF